MKINISDKAKKTMKRVGTIAGGIALAVAGYSVGKSVGKEIGITNIFVINDPEADKLFEEIENNITEDNIIVEEVES